MDPNICERQRYKNTSNEIRPAYRRYHVLNGYTQCNGTKKHTFFRLGYRRQRFSLLDHRRIGHETFETVVIVVTVVTHVTHVTDVTVVTVVTDDTMPRMFPVISVRILQTAAKTSPTNRKTNRADETNRLQNHEKRTI